MKSASLTPGQAIAKVLERLHAYVLAEDAARTKLLDVSAPRRYGVVTWVSVTGLFVGIRKRGSRQKVSVFRMDHWRPVRAHRRVAHA